MQLKLQGVVSFFIISLIFFATWLIQKNLLLNVDVSWLVEASRRMLSGGNYTKDFFENNPPWVLYFYAPAVLFSKLFAINIMAAVRLYLFALIALSLALCNASLAKLISPQDGLIATVLIIALAILYLVIPLTDFGQREHLLVILSMPYFFLMAQRTEGQVISAERAIGIGFLAGCVFLLKPYFLLPLCFVEIYYAFHKKNPFSWLRYEIAVIAFLLVSYLFILLVKHPDYLNLILPYASRWCYFGSKRPWAVLLAHQEIGYACLAFLFFFATYEINHYKKLTHVLLLALMGFTIAYLIQRVDYSYRMLPSYLMALFMVSLFFCIYAKNTTAKLSTNLYLSCFVAVLLIFLYPVFPLIRYCAIAYPGHFFGFNAGLLLMVLFLSGYKLNSNYSKTATILFAPLLLGACCFYVIAKWNDWSAMHLLVPYIAIIVSFIWFIPINAKSKVHTLAVTFLAAILFIMPFNENFLVYNSAKEVKFRFQKLINVMDSSAKHEAIYFFSTNLWYTFSVLDNTKDTWSASRFSGFWILPGLLKASLLAVDKQDIALQKQDKSFFINMVSDDLVTNKPKLIFVDTIQNKDALFFDTKKSIQHFKRLFIPFDYGLYFKNNKNFQAVWKNYHFMSTLEQPITEEINPLDYKYHLQRQGIPTVNQMKPTEFYLYLRKDGLLEIACNNIYDQINRITLLPNADLSNTQIIALKKMLLTPGSKLDAKNKNALFTWLAKQRLYYPFYKFNIYEANEV